MSNDDFSIQDYVPQGLSLDEQAIWKCLIHRDFLAFAKADWSIIESDFIATDFYGLSANHQSDKSKWTLQYPNLESYKTAWLKEAQSFQDKEVIGGLFETLMDIGKLTKMEIVDNLAIITKVFDGKCSIQNGHDIDLKWTSFFTMRKHNTGWKIESFVGYIPN